jgi:hypothetical protein
MPVVFPVDGSATRRSFPSAGSLGSVPQLHQYSGALRLPDALPALPRLPSAPRYLPMHVFSFPPRPMHWALRAWRLFPRFRRSGLFVDWRRQDLPSSQGTLVHSPRPQTPVGRVSQALSVLSGRPGAAFRHRDGVSHHNNQYFEAPSRGSRTRCLRFVAGLPFPTQDSLPAWCPPFSWAGLSPAGSLPRVSSGHRLTSSPQAGHSTYCRPANRLGLVDSWRTPLFLFSALLSRAPSTSNASAFRGGPDAFGDGRSPDWLEKRRGEQRLPGPLEGAKADPLAVLHRTYE